MLRRVDTDLLYFTIESANTSMTTATTATDSMSSTATTMLTYLDGTGSDLYLTVSNNQIRQRISTSGPQLTTNASEANLLDQHACTERWTSVLPNKVKDLLAVSLKSCGTPGDIA